MTQRFTDTLVDREARLSLGVDQETGTHFISIPVSNAMVDYEEYYRISDEQFAMFESDRSEARRFAAECRERLHDDVLILKPGADRGSPR